MRRLINDGLWNNNWLSPSAVVNEVGRSVSTSSERLSGLKYMRCDDEAKTANCMVSGKVTGALPLFLSMTEIQVLSDLKCVFVICCQDRKQIRVSY